MKLKFHHMNLCSAQVPQMDQFYRSLLDLTPVPGMEAGRVGLDAYGGHTTYVTDGAVEFHMSEKDHLVGFRAGHHVNPLDRGHIAFRTDDLGAFKRRLEDMKIPFSHYGPWSMSGWDQIFFYDPAGNVIEVHQVKN